MAGSLAASIVVFAVGAILDYALVTNPDQHGFNVQTVGVILMVVGAVGAVLSIIGMVASGYRKHRTVVDDDRGHVIRREDTYL
ncbi:MAG TPA: hypothetical protein VKW77_10370 [Acidimicrobiales bacterium]|nr:hypothetical protein [Acidimicrobiales bacterium]